MCSCMGLDRKILNLGGNSNLKNVTFEIYSQAVKMGQYYDEIHDTIFQNNGWLMHKQEVSKLPVD